MEIHDQPHGDYMANFAGQQIGKQYPGKLLSWQQEDQIFAFYAQQTILQVYVLSDKILRFRYANDYEFERDFSYAVSADFAPEKVALEIEENEQEVRISTDEIVLIVYKEDLKTKITNRNGLSIFEDEIGYHWERHAGFSGNVVISTKKLNGGEHFHGLGDKPSSLELRGRRIQMWGSDTYAYGPETDPIYKNIPFFIGLHHKIAYGIFLDNTFRTWFDFGQERPNVFSFWAQGGEMNYYFIYGPQAKEVAESYTHLTGRPELPPLWALGYQQSKWSYYPESVVENLAAEFRNRKIPCDVIHLDIDYMDGYRCFTWDKNHFPDPKKMIERLEEKGFKIISIIDPGIKIDPKYPIYLEGKEKDYFCHTADGPLFRGSVWPGLCHFPDFTNPEVRDWWAGLFKDLMASGLRGVWNDMNEPAVFEEGTFPGDIRHNYDGNPCSHRKAHNIYGMQMSKATYQGVKENAFPNRSFILTRSTYSGGQRYAAVWTGDNVASWEHLTIANVQCQRLSISGFSFVGSDVGGFVESPSGELYMRWVQMAIFHPFLRTHSSGDHGAQEPWSFGPEVEDVVRKTLALRYRLLPYLYTTFWEYVTYGTPMIRPLFMLDQKDVDTYYRQDEFALGNNLLICPITQSESTGRWLYLTEGEWYNFWNDQTVVSVGEEVWVEFTKESFPFFVRSGTVIPMGPAMQYVGEITTDMLELHAYFAEDTQESILYEDTGDGYGYQEGEFNIVTYELAGSAIALKLLQKREGNFVPSYPRMKIIFHGLPYQEIKGSVDGNELSLKQEEFNRMSCIVPFDFSEVTLHDTSE